MSGVAAESSASMPAWLRPHAVVLASAGTGKTYTLSARYLCLLLGSGGAVDGGAGIADPSTILATTFTRKAAGEILERVFRRLLEGASDQRQLGALAADLSMPLTRERCCAAAAALARRMDRVRIMTLDAMMQRLARVASLELDTSPGWSIGTERDLAAQHERAVAAALAEGDARETAALMRSSTRAPLSRGVHDALDRAVEDAYAAFLAAGAEQTRWDVVRPRTARLDGDGLFAAIQALEAAPVPTTGSGTPHNTYVKARDKCVTLARGADWEAMLDLALVRAVVSGERFCRVEIPDGLRASVSALVDHAAHCVIERVCARNRAIAALMARYDTRLMEERRRAGLLGFDDIPRLLVNAEVAGRLRELWYRLDAAVHHLLIDEAQDTSLVQFRLVRPILDELLSGRPDRGALVVGDVKQSLYAWRQAEAKLLEQFEGVWPILRKCSLAQSQRSSQVILNAVNEVFGGLLENPVFAVSGTSRAGAREAAESLQSGFEEHTASARAGGPDGPGLVRVEAHPLEKDVEKPKADTVAGAVGAVEFLLKEAREAQPDNPPEIGVLVRRNKFIRPIVAALREAGLEASEEGGAPLADDPVVSAVLSLLHMVDHPSDELARFHVAVSPIGAALRWRGVPSPARARAIASKIRRSLGVYGYAAVLERLVERAAPHVSPGAIERLDQLIALAREFDGRASLRPSELVELVCERRIARPGGMGGGRVRVMTIHAAKGLEFDAVVLPDLDRGWSPDGKGAMTLRPGPLDSVQAASMCAPRAVCALHPDLAAMARQRESREVFEELCSLYVGMTRARRALVMLVAPFMAAKKQPPLKASGVLRGSLGREKAEAEPGEQVAECRSKRHWWSPAKSEREVRAMVSGPAEVELRLAPPRAGSLRRARVVSPSSMEGGGVLDLASRLAPPSVGGGGGMEVGMIAHAMLERIDWLVGDAAPTAEELRAGGGVLAAGERDVEAAAALVARALRGECGRCLRRSWHGTHPAVGGGEAGTLWGAGPGELDLELRSEWPFLHAEAGADPPRLVSGVIDRLVLIRREGRVVGADILDFKSDAIGPGGALAARVEHYRPQVRAYAASVGQMLGLPAEAVRATLVFLSVDRVVTV